MRMMYKFYQEQSSSVRPTDYAEVTIYPNPTADLFHIRAERTIGSIVVYDLLGKEMLRKNTYSHLASVRAGVLPRGVYIVRVLDPEGKVITTRRLRKDNL